MGMERLRRLDQLWSWLPAFRATAETEHLPTASAHLHVSPSAISRAVRLLEDRVGTALFVREARRMRLSTSGVVLLKALRQAMRGLDDALEEIAGASFQGTITLSLPTDFFAAMHQPLERALSATHPGLVPVYARCSDRHVPGRLLNGTIDVAVCDHVDRAVGLDCSRLPRFSYGVYCGPGHRLFGESPTSSACWAEHSFIAPVEGHRDRWPPHLSRRVTARTDLAIARLQACMAGTHLALLPDLCAGEVAPWMQLWRLPVDLGVFCAPYLVRRRPLAAGSRSEAVATLLLEVVRSLAREPEPPSNP